MDLTSLSVRGRDGEKKGAGDNMLNSLKMYIASKFSKAYVYWGKGTHTGVRVMYFADNSMYIELQKGGVKLDVVLDKEYTAKVKKWLDVMYTDSKGNKNVQVPPAPRSKVIKLSSAVSLQRGPSSTEKPTPDTTR